jgi:benzoyl-CoA reductase subunit D
MITAGIDVGLENVKVVILKDGKVAGKASGRSGGVGRGKAAEAAYAEALKAAGISAADVNKVVSTGAGKYDVAAANDYIVEPVADANAARFLFPQATSVVDIGADQIRVVTLGEGDTITEVVLNQKCAGGLGMFLRFMARRLGMSIEELGALPQGASNGAVVNDGCSVFNELDALGLLNRGVPVKQVAGAVIDAAVVRMSSVLDDKVRPSKETTALLGGVTKNAAVIEGLKARSGIKFLIPADAEYGTALGAALAAAG